MADGTVPNAIAALDDEAAPEPALAPSWGAAEDTAPTHDEIAALAYSYWEARGGRSGSPGEDWLRAEQELLRMRKR